MRPRHTRSHSGGSQPTALPPTMSRRFSGIWDLGELGAEAPCLHPKEGPSGDTIAAEMAKGRNCYDPLSHTRNQDLEKSIDLPKVIQAASRVGNQVTNPGPGAPELGLFLSDHLGTACACWPGATAHLPASSMPLTQGLLSGRLAGVPALAWLRTPSCLLDPFPG